MKYLIAIIFVVFSCSQIFAQSKEIKKEGKEHLLEESNWKSIKANLNLSDKKSDQLRNLEITFEQDLQKVDGDERNVILARRDIELSRLLSQKEQKKYEAVTKRPKFIVKQN